MNLGERPGLALTSSLLAAFSIGAPWLWFTGYQCIAVVLGAGCICASALVLAVGYGAFER